MKGMYIKYLVELILISEIQSDFDIRSQDYTIKLVISTELINW